MGQVRGRSPGASSPAGIWPDTSDRPLTKLWGHVGGQRGASPGQVARGKSAGRNLAGDTPTAPSKIMRTPYSRSCLGNYGGKWGASVGQVARGKSAGRNLAGDTPTAPSKIMRAPYSRSCLGNNNMTPEHRPQTACWGQAVAKWGASVGQVRGKSPGASRAAGIWPDKCNRPLAKS